AMRTPPGRKEPADRSGLQPPEFTAPPQPRQRLSRGEAEERGEKGEMERGRGAIDTRVSIDPDPFCLPDGGVPELVAWVPRRAVRSRAVASSSATRRSSAAIRLSRS